MSSTSQNGDTWIATFCSLVGHEYFAEVSEDFIEDEFNMTGLQSQVPMYKEALEMILDVEPETDEYSGDEDEEEDDEENSEMSEGGTAAAPRHGAYYPGGGPRGADRRYKSWDVIESSAEILYGLIHQRFITSRQGIAQMLEKYEIGHFGACPRVHCRGAKVLPVGCSDIPGQDTVKLFCPSCVDVYAPPNSRFQSVDGAFFGTTFGCLFFMTYPELDVSGARPQENGQTVAPAAPPAQKAAPAEAPVVNGVAAHNLAPGLGRGNVFEPRIYGFRVSEFAKSGPRMKWLRMKPENLDELDEIEIWTRPGYPVTAAEGEVEAVVEGDGDDDGVVDDEEEEEEEEEGEGEGDGGQGAEQEKAVDDGVGRGKKARHREKAVGVAS